MFEDVFKTKKLIPERLLEYGFIKQDARMVYTTDIMNGMFRLEVYTDGSDIHDTMLFDTDTGDTYEVYKTSSQGSFTGKVRSAVEEVLRDIAERCCTDSVFKGSQTERIIEHVRNTYKDELEFLWPKFPDNAIWRKKTNGKWYGLIMTVRGYKLGLDTEKKLEIMDLRMDPSKKDNILSKKGCFPAWHMNKNSWYTIILNDSMTDKDIYKSIRESYDLI